MSEIEIKLNCYKFKEEHTFKKSIKTKIKEIKEDLSKRIEVDLDTIKFLFSSQNLEDNRTLEDYNIQNGNTIFYYYKKRKVQKKREKIPENNINDNNINNIDKNISNNTANDAKENNENSIIEEFGEKVGDYNLKSMSSIIKILTYNNLNIMSQILSNLKEKYYEDFENISRKKIEFTNYLKTPITKDDIETYKQNYIKAKSLLGDQGQNGKFEILITDGEEEYIKSWRKKGLKEATIILEYVKNKFDRQNTDDNLSRKLSEKFN